MNQSPQFTAGTAGAFKDFLRANNYPVNTDGDDLSVPNRFIVRQIDPNYPDNLLEQLKTGEKINVFIGKETDEPRPGGETKTINKAALIDLTHWWHAFWQFFCRFFNCSFCRKKPNFQIQLVQLCSCCDYSLIDIAGDQSLIDALNEGAIIRPGEDTNPRGAGLEIYGRDTYARNESIDAKKTEEFVKTPALKTGEESKFGRLSNEPKAVKVAVIDTGFRFSNLPTTTPPPPIHIWHNQNTNSPCGMQDDVVGWNFVGVNKVSGMNVTVSAGAVGLSGNNNPDDDNPGEHGTLLSAIVTQTASHFFHEPHQPEIMVLKAFDSCGVGTLFTIICAMCYAEKHDADIINASFVAYLLPTSTGASLLRQVIQRLNQAKIVVVCAAGNRKTATDTSGVELQGDVFPACFSREFQNVITVTSVWNNGDGRESYSSNYVNVGVVARHLNLANPARVGFLDAPYLWYHDELPTPAALRLMPPPVDPELVADVNRGGIDRTVGSSFSTAHVTGLVAAVLQNHGGISRVTPGRDFRDKLLHGIRDLDRTQLLPKTPWNTPLGSPPIVQNDYYVEM